MKIPLRFLKQSPPFAIAQNIVVLMILLFTGLPGSGVFVQSCAGSQVHFYNPVLGVDQTYTVPYDPGREVVLESFTPVGGSLGESPGTLTTNVSYESIDPTVAVIREEDSRFYLVIQGAGTSTIAVHYDDDPAGCKTVFTLEVLPPVIQPGVGNILYVNRGVSGGNGSGDRWTNAIPELRDALAWAADNWDADINGTLQVWVAKGKYLPTDNPADRGAYFPLLGSVEIYGGFNATETGLEDRDRQQNVTILSGDIDDNDTGVDGIITDPQTQIHGNNSHHVVIALDRDTGAVLDGVTITAGMADGTQFATAGNAGDSEGGGMFITGSSLTLTHITFRGNYASLGGGGLVVYSSDIEVAGSQLINNQSDNDGGGINAAHSTLTLINSTLTKNKGKSGGAISSSGGILMLINSTLSRNRAGADGGGINNMENTAVTLINSILSGNRAEGEGNEMYNSSTIDGVVSVSHSLYDNGTNDMVTADFGSGVTFETTAVIHADPQFADPDNDDYSLLATSPAINAGSNTLWENTTGSLTGSETDLAGNARVYAYANGGMIDIGAYEFQGTPEPPVVTDVVTPADSTYSAGENLDFTVNFDKNVDVNTSGGAPRLSITIGASTQYANYLSGSGTSSLVYRYTVQSGDQDNDGITVGALETNGGTIQNGNVDADLTLQNVGSTSDIRIDAVVPSGYSVSIDQAQINISNTSAVSFTFAGAEAGATYNYAFTSSGGGTPVTGSGTIITATDQISDVDLSSLSDGIIMLDMTLTDRVGNAGSATNDTVNKDTVAPAGYSVSIDQSEINATNEAAVSLTLIGAEVGAKYTYTFSSSGGGTDVSGSGTLSAATRQIGGIDLSGLENGTITLTISLEDSFGNAGVPVIATSIKNINEAPIATADEFSTDVNTVLTNNVLTNDSDPDGDAMTASLVTAPINGTVVLNADGSLAYTPNHNYVGLDSLNYQVCDYGTPSLCDTTSVRFEVIDIAVPTGYSVSWDDDLINASEAGATTFTVSDVEIGTTLHYTLSSNGDGNNQTISGTAVITNTTDYYTVDVSNLPNGTLTIEIYLTSIYGTPGMVSSDNSAVLDKTAPGGYVVGLDQDIINAANQSAVSFTFAGAETGATYAYTFSSSGGGTDVTGNGTIVSATDRVTGINLSGLGDGTVTLSAVLTDAAGNTGVSVTDTRIKKTNTAPTVTGVSVAGILTVGEQLTGHYTFTDPDGDTEAGSAYRWYRSDDDTGTGKTVISGALSRLYTLQGGDRGKYISFEVTPGDGDMSGSAVESSPVGPVKADQSVTFPAISAKTYGDATFTLGDAYTDRELLVTYTAADPKVVNINGNQATILRAGSTTITAVQPGDSQTNPAVAVEQTLTVNKAPLRITADDQSKVYGATDPALTVSYNGFVHNDEETLLEGTLSVSRAPGEDAGTYAITATGYTSDNYAISYTGGIFEITRAAITVTADGQTKVYGTADPELTYTVSPALAGNDTFTGMPVRETGEAVGEYTIAQGALTAGRNYNITFEEAILTITPANLEHIIFDDGGFTYDGSVHRLSVTGRLPADVSVTYLNNGRTDAGTQTVTARIDGGENYRDTELTATLTVYRATQHIVFRPIPSRNLESTSGFILDAYTASGLPVTYSYTYEGSGPAATVSPDGAVTLLSSGEITITANQEGNPNFLPAPPVSRTLRISSSDAAIRTLRIAGMVYENPGPETRYVVDCDRMAGSVEVAIETEANAIVNPAHQFTVDLPRPGLYTETITVISEDGNTTRTYKVVLEKRFASDDIIIQKFNNVLLVNNNPQTNGGYDFVTYAWYKNGNYTGSGQYYSAGDNSTDLLDPDATYHVEMTTTDGQVLRSCPMKPQIQHSGKIIVYPNPVLTGNTVNIQADIPEAKRENMKVQLYNHTGREIKHFVTDRKNNTVQVSGMLPGVYIIRCTTDDLQKSFKIIVK